MHLKNLTWVHNLETKRLKGETLELNTRVGVDVSHYYVHVVGNKVLASHEEGVNLNEEEGDQISSTQCKDAQVIMDFVDVVAPLEESRILHFLTPPQLPKSSTQRRQLVSP